MPLTLVFIEARTVLRTGMRAVAAEHPAILVVGESGSPEDAERLADELAPDVVVVGLGPPARPAVEAIRALRRRRVATLAVAADGDDDAAAAAVRAGVRGCLTVSSVAEELISAAAIIAGGGVVFARPVAERLSPLFGGFGKDSAGLGVGRLSPREQETLQLVAQGYDNRKIARELFLTEKTIRNRVSNIMTKLNVPSRAAAVALAWEYGHAD
ncbi:MAG: response regulator transcription factor [Catenulispora sp.]|nr:response regulator transcription factor [Catenulispora sp.]